MAATKEIKSLLKLARSALDIEEYWQAIKQCEVLNNIFHFYYNYTGSFLAG